jgi:parallel beta-helix repeat protein
MLLSLGFMMTAKADSGFSFLDPEFTLDPEFKNKPEKRPHLVAVLPFLNKTDNTEASTVVRRAIYNHFSSLGYIDTELTIIDAKLKQNYLLNNKLNQTPLKKLARILKVDAIIMGEVTSYSKSFALLASSVSVGASLKFIRLSDGKLLWSGKQTARSVDGSLPLSPIGAVTTIISNVMNVRESISYRVADEMARDIIKTIPNLEIKNVIKPPKISFFVHNAINSPKKAGDTLEIFMQGDKNQTASFDIGTYKTALPMTEIEPGIYQGRYQILPDDNVKNATIVAYLGNLAGIKNQWIDFSSPVIFDTIPPSPPQNMTILNQNKQISLKWQENTEDDLTAYEIWRSQSPLTGYKKIKQIEKNHYIDPKLKNQKDYYYKLRTLDTAGNTSLFSSKIKGHPVTGGPTPVSNDISEDTTWYQAASPYIIEKSILIHKNAHLTIEAGTEILFSEQSGLTIKGRLSAIGSKRNPIIFNKNIRQQQWLGLLFDNSKQKNSFHHCQITHAKNALVTYYSNISIQHSFLENNETALRLLNSKNIQIKYNQINHNSKSAIIIRESNPIITNNTITFNRLSGITIKNAFPQIKHNAIYSNNFLNILISNKSNEALNLKDNYWGSTSFFKISDKIAGNYKNSRCLKKESAPYQYKKLGYRRFNGTFKNSKKSPLNEILSQSANDFKKGHFSHAYKKLIYFSKQQKHPAAYYLLGRIYNYAGKHKESTKNFLNAYKLSPKEAGYSYYLGRQYLKSGKTDKAIKLWKRQLQKQKSEDILNILKALH